MSTAITPAQGDSLQRTVMEHIARYRMSVFEALVRVPALRHFGAANVKRLLRQVCQTGQLAAEPLFLNRLYYFLTQQGAAALTNPDDTDRDDAVYGPLSETAKVRNFAMLAFCCLGDARRERLTPADFKRHFPKLFRPGLPMNYYTDTTGQVPRLGFLRVDTGGHGRWDRILAKCHEDLQEHALDPGFGQFIRQGMFEITLVTTLPQKADRMQHTIADWRDAAKSLIRVAVVPELLNLIAPPPARPIHRTHSPLRGFVSLPRPGARKNNGRNRLLANRRSLESAGAAGG